MSTHNNDKMGFRAWWQVWLVFKLASVMLVNGRT